MVRCPALLLGLVGVSVLTGASLSHAQEAALVRDHHEIVFDVAAGHLVLFGGNSRDAANAYTYVADTWTLAAGRWERLAADGPEARSSFGMAYDEARKQTLVFGGQLRGRAFGDTWAHDGKGWSRIATEGPSARMSPAVCFDPRSANVLLFGGLGSELHRDTWAWNGKTWSLRSKAGPAARGRMAIFRDTGRESIVIHGGYVRVDGRGQSADDMWEWKGESWVEIDPGPLRPPPLSNHRAVYDERRKVAVLFGGSSERGVYRDETWEWDGARWTQRSPESRPPARGNFAMTYDAKLGRVVLHGGKNAADRTLSDTWTWDGEAWAPVHGPP